MKKALLILFTIVAIGGQAQNHLIGIKTGINLSNVSQELINTSTLEGFSGGITYTTIQKGHLMLGTDVLYNQRGFRTDLNFDVPGFEIPGFDIAGWEFEGFEWEGINTGFALRNVTYRNEYVSVPIKVGYIGGGRFKGYAQVGAVPSFLVSSKIDIPIFLLPDVEIDTKRVTNDVDWAGMLEAGFMYQLSQGTSFTGSVNYQRSLTPQYTGWVDRFNDSYGRNVNISLGLAFQL